MYTFLAGFLLGLATLACLPRLMIPLRRLWYRMGEDEEFLLSAGRAALGRLIFSSDPAAPTTSELELKEFPHQRRLGNHGQVENLLKLGLIEPDPTRRPERFVLTPKGWIRAEKFPVLPLVPMRQGAWYNSISGRSKRPLKR